MKKSFAIFSIGMMVVLSIVNIGASASQKERQEDLARVTCSATVNGITYTVSAGSIFTSTETAAERCAEKLADAINGVQ